MSPTGDHLMVLKLFYFQCRCLLFLFAVVLLIRMAMHIPLLTLLAFVRKIESGPESRIQREKDWD
jgi:hypothetical protein